MEREAVLILGRANLGSPQNSLHTQLTSFPLSSVPVNFFEHGAVCWEVAWQEVEKRSKIGPEKVGKWLENGRKVVFGRKMVEKWSAAGRREKSLKKVAKRSQRGPK